jgi:predicted dehydrogenase
MSEPRKVRIGLVGCGYWGPKVIRAAASLPDVEVAALIDFREDLREALLRHYPLARSTATLGEALAAGPLDAVIVATNPATHVEVAAEAIEGGCHVMVEKPLALSAADCRALGAKAQAAGLVLMAGHTFRFSPLVNHVRSLVESGDLGEIYSIDSQRLNLGRVRKDVDAIWNFAPHDISILNYWLDEHPRAVHCHAYDYLQPGIPDLAFLVLEYEHAVAHVHISWLHPTKVRRMTVVGSAKMVVYDDVENQIVVHDAGIDRERVDRSFPDFETFGEFRLIQRVGDMHIPRIQLAEPLALQCRHFVDCITSGTEPVTDFEDAARDDEELEPATATHSKDGARVAIPDLP